ncbi:hypothetical protein [Streptomyces sp. NPDC007905]|uniref:hypothetical protein n=1 Tax=Streptomyces sp. NPDC007905 TaxID=3364788 RepID=UPI0036E16CDC
MREPQGLAQRTIDEQDDTTVRTRLYQWPQPGLRVAHHSRFEPSSGVGEEHQGEMPRTPPRSSGPHSRPSRHPNE